MLARNSEQEVVKSIVQDLKIFEARVAGLKIMKESLLKKLTSKYYYELDIKA